MGRDGQPATDDATATAVLTQVLGGLGAIVVVGLIGWLIGAGGWPGEPSGCIAAGDCSCEAFAAGFVVQPINTASNSALVLAGLGLLWMLAGGVADRGRRLLYAALVIGLGVGSAAFHASMTEWGGWMDLLGIHLFLGFVLALDIADLGLRSDRWIYVTLAVGGIVAGVLLWFMDNGLGRYSAAALVVAIAGAEWRIARRGLRPRRRWLWLALGLFGIGLVLQLLGRGGGAWCDPDRVLQAHAVWHFVAAGGAVALARYLFPASERST